MSTVSALLTARILRITIPFFADEKQEIVYAEN